MNKNHKKADGSVRRILKMLGETFGAAHPSAIIEAYRYNPASIRIRIVDPLFRGLNLVERDNLVRPYFDLLPDKIRAEIMLLLLLTPAERKRSFGSMEFDDPTPSPPDL